MSQNASTNPAHAEQAQSQTAQLEGRTVVIFGGTSGIGLAAAIQAKAAGAKVIVIGFERDRAQQVAAENGFDGWRAADVTRSETIYEALADIPRVDHLALLAGTFVAGKVLEADVGHLRKAFDERIWGSVHAIRAPSATASPRTGPSRSSPGGSPTGRTPPAPPCWPLPSRAWRRSPGAWRWSSPRGA